MHFSSLVTLAYVAIAHLAQPILAVPTNNSIETRATVPCDTIAKYTFPYIYSKMCKRPPASTCLFYTRGMSKTAIAFAKKDGAQMTTIWELWPESWYNKKQVKSNPLRCIMQNKNDRQSYFAAMSNAMAQTCDVFATVMDPDPYNVRVDGIWGTVEYPQLVQGSTYGRVYSIDAINKDASKVNSKYWSRERGTKRDIDSEFDQDVDDIEILKRDGCGIDAASAAVFDEGGEYPVDW